MKTGETRGQGLTFATDEFGRLWPIPAGGSSMTPPPTQESVSEDEGTVSEESQEVQSGEESQETQSSEPTGEETQTGEVDDPSGQGFLEPYLKDVPEDQREIVEPVLEKFRQEQDRNFNQRFEQIRAETEVPVTIHRALVNDPINTVNWVAERFKEEQGLDLRAELLKQWTGEESQIQSGQGQEPQSGQEDEDRPLTKKELQDLLQQREEEQRQQQLQQQTLEQQRQQQEQTISGWVSEAASKFNVPLDDKNGPDPLRDTIILYANSLHEQGQAKGQAAIEMATEAIAKRMQVNSGNNNKGDEPKTANGGTAPPAQEIDFSNADQRKARMEELFAGGGN